MFRGRQTGARARRLFFTVVVGLAGAAGVAFATTQITSTTQGQTSSVSACANKTNGDLRLVSGAGDCRTNEQFLSWSVVGPQGPQGVQGVQGVQGPAGKDGQSVATTLLAGGDPDCLFGGASFTAFNGRTYACNGVPGKDGANGLDGHNGANGKDGANGLNGHDGANGADGVSVTSTALVTGDPTCQYGGTSFTSASGTTYACNGAPGKDGQNGRDGTTGAGLTSFDAVNGLPCTRDGQTGAISTSYGGDGTVTLKCTVTINIATDVHNCGAVGHDVSGTYANATTVCVSGAPQFGACNAGFADWNNDLSDGCELTIVPDGLEPDDTLATAATYPAGSPMETISPAGDVDVYAMGPHGECNTSIGEFITSTTCSSRAPVVQGSPRIQVTFLDGSGHPVSGDCSSTSGTNTKTGVDFDSTTCTATTIDNMRYVEITSTVPAAYTIN